MPTPSASALADPVLARCTAGYVRRCPCCSGFELRFDGTTITLSAAQLRQLRSTLSAVCSEAGRPGACWGWTLRVRTSSQQASFLLWTAEAEALGVLLDEALATLDLDTLLVDVLGPRPPAVS
ncbi:MAG: hypothetical protein AAGI91_00340 [Bacteroidota bacterium]